MPDTLPLVDLADNPHLSGRFAPIGREISVDALEVEGELPGDLTGAYVRNGPNPRYPPLGSYTYPMEGDGMLHGVWLEGGRARYRNRWVLTSSLRAEMAAGRALFGGMMTPALVDMKLLGPDPDPGWPIKLDAFINIVRHAGRWLALPEGLPPYEVTAELETVGRYTVGGALPNGMCAHPKADPATGELVVFRYDVEAPFLSWAVLGADGSVARPETPVDGVDAPFMIHDFAITPRWVVLVVAPALIDLAAMGTGRDVLRWEPERGTKVALIDRSGTAPVRWIELDPFFVWHYANAFEQSGQGEHEGDVIVDFPWWSRFTLGGGAADPLRGGFARMCLDPATGSGRVDVVDGVGSEFPRIDDRLTGQAHRHVTVSRKSGRRADLITGEFDQLARHDLQTGQIATFDADAVFGEVVFAPRDGATGELDGYYLTYATAPDASRSWLLIWDAAAFPADPVARVRMPQRVPHGLHGNWFPPT